MREDLIYELALSQVPFIGPLTVKKLISQFGSAKEVLSASKKSLSEQLSAHKVESLLANTMIERSKQELAYCEKYGISVLSFYDDAYPFRLKSHNDAPGVLFYRGNPVFNHRRTLGIVGTRTPSEDGKIFCKKIVQDLVDYEPLIVSGLAYGIDVTAHRQALQSGIKTLGIVGTGMDKVYPDAHTDIAKEMTRSGAVMSQFWSKVKPDRENFPMRNKTLAAICDVIVVVQSAESGGSMITANFAHEMNKDIFAVPGFPTEDRSIGCNDLIRDEKATLLSRPSMIAEKMGWKKIEATKGQTSLFHDLNDLEREIVAVLSQQKDFQLELLALELQKPISQLVTELLNLEFKGLIKSLPGSRYRYIG